MTQLKGKRLLFLGASHYQVPGIENAKQLGCYVITLDNRADNPGHRLADDYEVISTVDEEAVLKAARRRAVDGVMTYGSDVSAPTVAYVAHALGLPGNPPTAGRILQRKDLFRRLQAELGLPHPAWVNGGDTETLGRRLREHKVPAPWMVKPADASGSKGQTLLKHVDGLPKAFDHARRFSRCGVVLAESFLSCDVLELVGDVLIKNGMIAFRHYGHNYFLAKMTARVPVGEIMPARIPTETAIAIDEQMEAIAQHLEVRQGCINFDAILSGGEIHLIDIGLRSGGNYVPDLIELSTGFNMSRAAVYAAMGHDYPSPRRFEENARPVLSYILNARTSGIFDGLEIEASLQGYVCKQVLFVEKGATVAPFERGDYALGIVLLRLPDMNTLDQVLSSIEHRVVARIS